MKHHAVLTSFAAGRSALLGTAMVAALLGASPVLADVPPASSSLGNPASGAKAQAEKLAADAAKALKGGNIRLALINLKNAVTADPHNGAVRTQLGVLLLRAGDEPAAERELRQARKDGAPLDMVLPPLFQVMLARNEAQLLLDQFPDPGPAAKGNSAADILKARALAFQSLKKAVEASDAMDHSLAIRRDAHGLLVRARLSLIQGDVALAKKYADEAVAKSDNPDAMLFKIGISLSANDGQQALEESNRLLAKYPGSLQGRFARVEAYLSLQQDAKAKAEISDIVAKYPNSYTATYYQALLLARGGDSKAGWNIAQNLPGEFRDSQPRFAVMIAQMAADAGNEDTAASILNRILLKNPGMGSVRMRLAGIRLKQNNPDEALNILQPLKDSQDIQAMELLSNAYLRLHRNNDALNMLKRMDAASKGRADVERSMGLLEIQMGDADQGIKHLAQAAAKAPTDPAMTAPLIGALVQAGRFPEALAAADRLGKDPKQRPVALVQRASVLLAQKDNAGAQAALDKAVAADPRNVTSLYSRAEFLAGTGHVAEANRDLRAILSLDGKNMQAFLKLAEIAASQGDDRNVRTILGQAIAAQPQSAAPRTVLARYLLVRRDYKGAAAAAGELVKAEPRNTEGLAMLGEAQSALGQKKEAISSYRRLVSLMPTDAGAQMLLGNALASAGDHGGAMQALQTAVKLNPSSPQVRAAQISFLMNQGNADAGLAAARAFQAAKPGPEADILLSESLEKAKRHDQAIAVLDQSLASGKASNVVLLKRVRYAIDAGDSKRATSLLSNWLSAHADDGIARLEYASLLMQQEDNGAAVTQYQTILKQDPNNVIALNNLGWLLQSSDPKRALSMLTQAATLSPNSADVADTLGWVKLQQKDAAGALPLLQRAHSLKPGDATITYHLVVALDANAKRDAARGLLQALLASNAQFKDRPAAMQLASGWR